MSYIDQILVNDEEVLATAKPHKIIFLPAVLFTPGMISGLSDDPIMIPVNLLLPIALWAWAIITYKTAEFAVTNKRIICKQGFIKRESVELMLSKTEGVSVDQGVFGRIFGWGTIIVSGTGTTKGVFHRIARPLAFSRVAQNALL